MKPPTEIIESSILRDTILAQHQFNDTEKLELGRKLVACRQEERRIEAQFDSIKSEYKGKLQTAETETNTVETKLSNGFEMRQTPAIICFNYPEKGRKSAFREGTDGKPADFLSEECMTHADFQRPLFDEKKETNEELAESFDPTPEPHPMPPDHLPEARAKAPSCTVSINGGPEVPLAKFEEAVERVTRSKRKPTATTEGDAQ